jgi:chromosome segregation ATPase
MNTNAIESREQNLIQRIRTSGLVQSREVLLVDEVLEIRKERRQLFTKMNGEISMLQEMSQRWEQKALSLEQRIDQLQREFLRREEDRKIKNREEIENAKQEMLQHREKEASLAQAEFSRREEIMKIRYENQLQELAAKIEQVTIEQKSHDLTQAKVIANKLVKKISSELEEKFLRKVREYKESLVQVAEREKQLEEQLTEKEKSIVELTQKEKLMMDTLNSLQSRLEAVYLQEKEQERRKMQLIHENDSLRENNAALEKKIGRFEIFP